VPRRLTHEPRRLEDLTKVGLVRLRFGPKSDWYDLKMRFIYAVASNIRRSARSAGTRMSSGTSIS